VLEYLGFRAIAGLTGILPGAWQYAIARRVSDGCYLLDRRGREELIGNLRGVLGPSAPPALVRHEARGAFRSFGAYLCEFFGHERLCGRFIDEHVVVLGRENLEAALGQGRGAMFCSGHYSNWEFGASIVAHLGYPITIVVQMHADPRVAGLFVQQRRRVGVQVVGSQHGAKGALKALRQNQTVALMGDRRTGGPGIPVRFCGRQTCLPQGPWRIALISGAALLPTFMHRRSNDSFTLEIGAALQAPAEGTLQERMACLAQAWADRFAACLRADPSQWAAFRSVWYEETAGAGLETPSAPAGEQTCMAVGGSTSEEAGK